MKLETELSSNLEKSKVVLVVNDSSNSNVVLHENRSFLEVTVEVDALRVCVGKDVFQSSVERIYRVNVSILLEILRNVCEKSLKKVINFPKPTHFERRISDDSSMLSMVCLQRMGSRMLPKRVVFLYST